MSKYTDDLKTLILDHEHVIQNYESRIEDLPTEVSECQIVLIRSQLEFFALNVRALKQSKEQELERALQMESFEKSSPALISPASTSGIPWPDPPDGAVARAIYRKKTIPCFYS